MKKQFTVITLIMCLVMALVQIPALAVTDTGWPFIPSDKNMTNGKIKSGWNYIYSHDMGTFRIDKSGVVGPSRIGQTPFYMEHLGKDEYYIHAPNGGYLAYKGNVSDTSAPIIISDKPCKWVAYVDNSDGTIRYVLSPGVDHKYFIKTWGLCSETQDSKVTLSSLLITAECKFTFSNYVPPETIPQWWVDYKSGKSAPTDNNVNQPVYTDINVPAGLANTSKEEWYVLRATNIERAQAGLPLLVTFDLMQKMAGVRGDELTKSYSHTRPDGSDTFTVLSENGFTYSKAAENIAKWPSVYFAEDAVEGWMNSEGHKKNILTKDLRYMGTGYTKTDNTYWVQLFANDSNSDCASITYNKEGSYFELKLKSGVTSYAPYNPISSPTVNGKVTFNYPGANLTSQDTSVDLKILAYPSKTNYRVGDGFDITGINAVIHDNNVDKNINDKISFYTSKTVELTQGRPFTTIGKKVVELRYEGKKVAEYTINVGEKSVDIKHPFTDVPSGAYYENPVIWALNNNITSGTSATTFAPNETCTRGQVVTFLWRAKGCPEPDLKTSPFIDVKADDYFYKAVLWAVGSSITSGTSATTFSPNATCTSGQVVTFLWRSNGSIKENGTSNLAKQYEGQYYTDTINWAENKGILIGTATAFAPNNNSPRADIVTYLYRNAGSPAIK